LHTADATEFEYSAGGKTFYCPDVNVCYRKGTEIGQFFSLDIALNISEKGFTILKTIIYQIVKSEKYETVFVSKLQIWLQKRGTSHSLVVRRVSPGKILFV